jgi:hypothetical protein
MPLKPREVGERKRLEDIVGVALPDGLVVVTHSYPYGQLPRILICLLGDTT